MVGLTIHILPLIYPPFVTIFVHLLKSTEKATKKSYRLLAVLLHLYYLFIKLLVTIFIYIASCFICYLHPC
jgi:ACR3 family arsenite efflux pump ArsB